LTFHVIYSITIHLLSVLVLLIVAEDITNFECGHVAKIGVEESCLGANNRVNLPQSLHRAEIGEIDIGWDQVDVPKHEVGVEVDHSLHTDVRQIRQVDHETSHDVKHDAKFVYSVIWVQVDELIGESTH
jgi:hypothetical protein